MPDHPAAKSLRDDVASYRANGTIITDETLRDWERRLTKLAFPDQAAEYVPREGDPIVLLADAVNQLGMVVEEIAQRTTWGGYVIESKARRQDWIERVRHERERIAELIPQ